MEGIHLFSLLGIVTLFLCLTLEASGNSTSTGETEGICLGTFYSSSQTTTTTGSDNNTVLVLKIGFTPDNSEMQSQVTVNLSRHHVQMFQECICDHCFLGCTIRLNDNFEAEAVESNRGGIISADKRNFECALRVDRNTFVNATRIRCEKRLIQSASCAANKEACQLFSHLNIPCNQSHYRVSWNSSQKLELQYVNNDFVNATYCNSGCPQDNSDDIGNSDEDVTPIIIGVVLGIAALLLVAVLCFILCRRRNKSKSIVRKYQTKTKLSTSEPDTCCHDIKQKDSGDSTGLRNGGNKRDRASESSKYTSILFDRNSTASENFPTEKPVPNTNNNKVRDNGYTFNDGVEPNSFQTGNTNNGHLVASSTSLTRDSSNEQAAETNFARPISTHVYSKLGEKVLHVHDPYNVISVSDESTHDVVDATKSSNENEEACSSFISNPDDSAHGVVNATKSTNQIVETYSSSESNVDNLDSVKLAGPLAMEDGSQLNTKSANSGHNLRTKPKAEFHIVDKKGTNKEYFELEKAVDSDQESVDNQETESVFDFNRNDDDLTPETITINDVYRLGEEVMQTEYPRRVSDV